MSLDLTQTTWNLSPLLDSDTDPSIDKQWQEIEQANRSFAKKWKGTKNYLTNSTSLLEALNDYELLYRHSGTGGNITHYFGLRSTQDDQNPIVKAADKKYSEASTKLYNEIQFFELTLAGLSSTDFQKFISEEPKLETYRHFVERVQAGATYLLSEPEERIMNLKSQTSHGNWVELTENALGKAQRETLTEDGTRTKKGLPELISLLQNPDKKIRDAAATGVHSIVAETVDLAEAEINSILANKKINDELRNMPRPDLGRHLGDDISSEAIDALIKTVEDHFPIAQRYYALKAQLLGQKKLAYHERNIQYGNITKKYPYPEAAELVHSTFQKLDPEFAEIFAGFLKNGQIDVFPRLHKHGGAFCSYNLITQPTYVLLNHTDTLNDVLTIAHELGHGINNELMKKKQHALHFGTPMATAEVASTFMEDFVLQELLAGASEEERLAILMMKLNDDVSSIFRQVACYRFEQDLHTEFRAKSHLTKEEIGKLFTKNMEAYMGPAVEQSPGSENWWVYWSHIRSFFYVYSYASGLLISKSLQAKVKTDPKEIGKIKEFLSAGLSDSPYAIFKKLDIDITDSSFWKEGLQEIEELLNETETLAKKLGFVS